MSFLASDNQSHVRRCQYVRFQVGGGDMNNAKVDQITRSQYVGRLNLRNFL